MVLQVNWNSLCFDLWPLSLYSSNQLFMHLEKLPLSLLFSWLSSLSYLSLSLPEKCSSPLIIFMPLCCTAPVCPCLSCAKDPRTEHSTPDMVSPGSGRGEGSPLSACWKCSALMQPKRLLAFFAARACCWLCSAWCPPAPQILFLIAE